MDGVGKGFLIVLFMIGMLCTGASIWIVCERLRVVAPMCLVDEEMFQQATGGGK